MSYPQIMKIAFVTAFYTPAICGVKQVIEELAERLVKQGHEVHVYCSDSDKYKRIKKKEEIINGVHVHRCFYWFKVSRFAYVFPSVFFKLLKQDFDIIHSHVFGHAHTFFAALASKIKKIPHIHTTHCPWTEEYRPLLARLFLYFSYRTFGKLSFKWCNKIIAITPWEYQFIKKWGCKEKQIINIPNGMDNILLKKIKPNKFKKKHRINNKDKLVLFFGRLNITKAPDKFVIVAKEILKQRTNITFVIRGPDEGMKDKVKKLIGNEKKILLLSETRNKKEIAEMYQAVDVYVLPSYREGLPLTLFEAMASGLPIVASPVNGVPYEMENNVNGFFVNYGDLKNLKEKILKILDNKKLAKKFSQNNIKKAKNYSWDDILKRTKKVYEEFIRKHDFS